ncbi:MAG: PrgI family protein [Clostridiaceae bacterium]|nr:PrgI family protein [Clostridiaceae bacterium]
MGTYNIPRNVKGEGRILFIFSTKSLIYSAIGAGIGLPLYFILSAFELNVVGIIIMLLFALIGFGIGTFKFPEFAGLKFTKTIGGENVDDIIKRAINFNKKGKKIYIYTKEEEKNG